MPDACLKRGRDFHFSHKKTARISPSGPGAQGTDTKYIV
nr:MAG TPA: hypothetical protein [Caudoviricetes sp.]